jgi:imidazolonepropionase-like amidohydrolase
MAQEFNATYIIKGNGDEYQWLDAVKQSVAVMILPINFPKPYDVTDANNSLNIPLANLKHWELAPYNPARLQQAGVEFAITEQGATNFIEFNRNLRNAIDKGMTRAQALKSLTYTPAQLLKVYDKVGSLEKGKVANFIIVSDTLFTPNAVILQNWIQGKAYTINNNKAIAIRGIYDLKLGAINTGFKLKVEGRPGSLTATLAVGDTNFYKADIQVEDNLVSLWFNYPHDSTRLIYRLNGSWQDSTMSGQFQDPQGQWGQWLAKNKKSVKQAHFTNPGQKDKPGEVIYPFTAYGSDSLTVTENIVFKHATLWTNEAEGIVQDADIWIKDGKIVACGKNLNAHGARQVDASGKHITSGIIDEHSHIAISQGVNEGTQSVTSEVRIGDVVNSEDINIYRQLSGGVTCAHLLHGSANTIGGQTQLIKLRWGRTPEEMKFAGWPGFIKFALGENVKQANWGDNAVYRYPQTRMGVEQTLYDAFIRARAYGQQWDRWQRLPDKLKKDSVAPRRDLKLDALVEILYGKRFITCHSYVQSEINMLLHVADSMHFKMNTFTHILEGYKVADKMKAHGVYASTFADWWAYKMEVQDAIPYNAALLTQMGITTAINSDDAEMGRRLNQEAAKSMKYGGLTAEAAWKLCTLNPAIMLHVSDKVGSLKPGKDADIVIWSANPLSIYAKVEATYIDGACYFSIGKDLRLRAWMQTERQRLAAKMLQARMRGEGTQSLQLPVEEFTLWQCDTDGVWVR